MSDDIFEKLKKFLPGFTSVNIVNSVEPTDFDIECEFINESDKDFGDDNIIIEIFSINVDASIEDFGIGSYEFWGIKGTDTQLGFCVNNLKFEIEWPKELKWLEEDILDKISESISELPVENNRDNY